MEANNVIEVVSKTREITLPHYGNIEAKGQKSEFAIDAFTEIDQKVEKHLQTELAKIVPDAGFVGEEFGGERGNRFWLVDPIDGTGHYIRGMPMCTTMLALVDSGQVVFSIIYDFVNDVLYHAERGKGAYRNNEKISVSNRTIRGAYLSCEINSQKEANKALLSEIRSRANLINTLCSGYEFALVASGKIEGRLSYDGFGKDWDYAPGSLLVSEAGGIVRNFKSDTYDYTNLNLIASNPEVYKELVRSENSIENLIN